MARPDLTAKQVEAMVEEHGPGSAREYLEERRREIEAEKQAEREAADLERYTESFVAAGGKREDAEVSYEAHKFEQAATAARQADEASHVHTRRYISGRL